MKKTLKIRICGLPLSVSDISVLELLENLKLDLKSKILYEKIRHPVTKRMTTVLNGNCFVYIAPLSPGTSLARVHHCAGLKCLFFTMGSLNMRKKLCAPTAGTQITPGTSVKTTLNARCVWSKTILQATRNANFMSPSNM